MPLSPTVCLRVISALDELSGGDRIPPERVHPPLPRRLIVTVNFNSAEELRACIASIPGDEFDAWLIVDNASPTPGEAERLGSLVNSKISLLKLPENRGFGAGVNAGIEHLDPRDDDLVWILNPDTIVREGTLDRLADALRRAPRSILTPTILDGRRPGEVWFSSGHIELRSFRTHHRSARRVRPTNAPFIPGTAMALRGGLWRELGGFRPDLFMYWEDADLCIRAFEKGVATTTVDDAVIVHLEGVSSAEESAGPLQGRSELYYFHVNRNRVLVAREHATRRLLLSPRFVFVSLGMLTTPLRRERRNRLRKLRAAFRGLREGFRAPRAGRPAPLS